MRLLTVLVATIVAGSACKPDAGSESSSAKPEPTGGAASSAAATAAAQASAPTSATAGATAAAAVEARVGGQVALVGDHAVELKLYERGLVEAWVYDKAGK